MQCSINNFKETFPQIKGNRTDITNIPVRENMKQWANLANNHAKALEFGEKLFTIKEENGKTFLEINEGNHKEFQKFVKEKYELRVLNEQMSLDLREDALLEDTLYNEEITFGEEVKLEYKVEERNFIEDLYSTGFYDNTENNTSVAPKQISNESWLEYKESVLANLKESLRQQIQQKGKSYLIQQLSNDIETLQSEIDSIQIADGPSVMESVQNEITDLINVLQTVKKNPSIGTNLILANNVIERVANLENLLSHDNAIMRSNLQDYIDQGDISEQEGEAIRKSFNTLVSNYKDTVADIVLTFVLETDLMKENERVMVGTEQEKDYYRLIDRIKRALDVEDSEQTFANDKLLSSLFLGAGDVDNLLINALYHIHKQTELREASLNINSKYRLNKAWDKIKNVKLGKKKYFADLLFKTGRFGERLNSLINIFTPDFYSSITNNHVNYLKTFSKEFNKEGKDLDLIKLAYSNWMESLRNNFEIIDLRNIESFFDEYHADPDFGPYLNSWILVSPEYEKEYREQMQKYEKELRAKYGDAIFEVLLEEQIEAVKGYKIQKYDKSEVDSTFKNPLAFMEQWGNRYDSSFLEMKVAKSMDYENSSAGFFIPSHISFSPKFDPSKKEEILNKDFLHAERMAKEYNISEEFKDFYQQGRKLLKYTRDGAKVDGVYLKSLEILSEPDFLNREVMKNYNFLGKAYRGIYEYFSSMRRERVYSNVENPYDDPDYVRKMSSKITKYGEKARKGIADTYRGRSNVELIELAKKEGLKIEGDPFSDEDPHMIELKKNLEKTYIKEPKVSIMAIASTFNLTKKEYQKLDKDERVKLITEYVNIKAKEIVHEQLRDAISRQIVNRDLSLDLNSMIQNGASIVEDFIARKTAESYSSLVNSYLDITQEKIKENKTKYQYEGTNEEDVTKTKDALNSYHLNNIWRTGHRTIRKIFRKELKLLGRYFTPHEKEFRRILKEEQKNLSGNFDFEYEGFTYFTKQEGGKTIYYKAPTKRRQDKDFWVEIPRNTSEKIVPEKDNEGNVISTKKQEVTGIEETYLKKMSEMEASLGVYRTLGSFAKAITGIAFVQWMYVKARGFFVNHLQSWQQQNQMAAGGRFGIDRKTLNKARRMVRWYYTQKYLHYTRIPKLLGIGHTKKFQQVDMILHIAGNLKVFYNAKFDTKLGDGSNPLLNSSRIENIKTVMSDFALNIPELHSQIPFLVALLSKETLEAEDGSTRPLIDLDKQEMPFNPLTMNFNEENKKFATPKNIANWVEFRTFEDENEFSHPAYRIMASFRQLNNRANGNYDSTDKSKMQGDLIANSSTAYMKWLFGNLNNEYGTKNIEMVGAQLDMKGKQLPMYEHFPLLATHMILNNVRISGLNVAGALTTFMINPILGGVVFAGTFVTPFIFNKMLNKNKLELKMQRRDLVLSMNYLAEVLARTVQNTSSFLTAGQFMIISDEALNKMTGREKMELLEKKVEIVDEIEELTKLLNEEGLGVDITGTEFMYETQAKIEDLQQKLIDLGLGEHITDVERKKLAHISSKDRRLISEVAQQVADRFTLMAGSSLTVLGLMAIKAIINSSGDDDDELAEELARLDKIAMTVINVSNRLTMENRVYSSIYRVFNAYSATVLFEGVMRNYEDMTETFSNIFSTGGNWRDYADIGITAANVSGFMSNSTKKFLMEDRFIDHYGDTRIYMPGETSIAEKWALSFSDNPETKAKRMLEIERNDIRARLEYSIRRKVRLANPGASTETVRSEASQIITDFMKAEGYYKEKDYSRTYDKIRDKKVQTIKKGLEINIKNPPKKKSTTRSSSIPAGSTL